MGLEGFSNNASGGMSPGEHLYAKSFNKLAMSADKAQIGPSDGVIFTSNNGGVGMYIPQQFNDEATVEVNENYQQFQLRSVSIEVSPNVFVNKLQLAKGTVNFTQSNMPRVRTGGHNDQRQGWIFKTAVLGSGISAFQGEGDNVWMENGGYYNINSPGTYYVTISKLDINSSNDDTDSELLNAEAPFISIFKSGDSIEDAIFSETGQSEYVNKMNVHKMDGYDAASTGLSGDWGNCHTTWFNPVKWGYSVKLIGIVTATTQVGSDSLVLSIDQHIVGPIYIDIPIVFNGSTLCNQSDLNEANDPYNLNKNSTPKWSYIVNADTLTNLEQITPATLDWYQEFVGPADWTSINYVGLIPASCAAQDDGQTCEHPFQFHPFVVKVDPQNPTMDLYRANVCAGMVNNLVPWDEEGPGKVKLPAALDFLINQDTYIYLRLGTEAYASNSPVFPVTDDTDEYYPTIVQSQIELTDTDEFCYILMGVARNIGDPENFTVDQTISGSVWAERLKVADLPATYYWAGV